MTEQEERAKVIAELERVADEANPWKESPPLRCDISYPLLIDALTLLKAQEPRVMTLSGVRNLKQSTPVWLEDVDKKDVIGALFMQDYSGTKCIDFAIVRDWKFERVVADYMDYGVRWRCWTSRPDEKRRAEKPWESVK